MAVLVTACRQRSRVQIVLSKDGSSGRSGPREPHLQDQGACSSQQRRGPGWGLGLWPGASAQRLGGAPGTTSSR